MYNWEKRRLDVKGIMADETGVKIKKEEMNYMFNVAAKKMRRRGI